MQNRPQARLSDLDIFVGLEGLCTSIQNILYFLPEIENDCRMGRHLDFPILALNALENTRKLTNVTPLYFYNVEC